MLSQYVKEEFQRQLTEYGYVKTVDHRKLKSKMPKLCTTDNVLEDLYWVISPSGPARPFPVPVQNQPNGAIEDKVRKLG